MISEYLTRKIRSLPFVIALQRDKAESDLDRHWASYMRAKGRHDEPAALAMLAKMAEGKLRLKTLEGLG